MLPTSFQFTNTMRQIWYTRFLIGYKIFSKIEPDIFRPDSLRRVRSSYTIFPTMLKTKELLLSQCRTSFSRYLKFLVLFSYNNRYPFPNATNTKDFPARVLAPPRFVIAGARARGTVWGIALLSGPARPARLSQT